MAYLESERILHRDLRACNVLVGGNLEIKVSDFGLSHFLRDSCEYYGTSGMLHAWIVPQMPVFNLEERLVTSTYN